MQWNGLKNLKKSTSLTSNPTSKIPIPIKKTKSTKVHTFLTKSEVFLPKKYT